MSLGKQLARLFDFEIYDDTDYVEIGGVTNFSPSTEKNDADTTDFDSEGWLEHIVASRGLSFEIEGYHIEDEEDGSRDGGQEALENYATEVGSEAMTYFHIITPGENDIYMEVSVEAPPHGISGGGGNDDPAAWSATLTVSGKPETSDMA